MTCCGTQHVDAGHGPFVRSSDAAPQCCASDRQRADHRPRRPGLTTKQSFALGWRYTIFGAVFAALIIVILLIVNRVMS